jgi:hypothetical protein
MVAQTAILAEDVVAREWNGFALLREAIFYSA